MPSNAFEVWLGNVLPKHERLTASVVAILIGVLENREIEHLNVDGRTKTFKSVNEKIKRKSYSEPIEQITDLSGARVILYFQDQIPMVESLIRELFVVDEKNSASSTERLGNDKVGYQSIHFVCKLGDPRQDLPEYEGICDLKFEVQVRTVLQHAWAQFTHDRTYKFAGVLPKHLQRQVNLYSGMLEVIDNAFSQTSQDLAKYVESLADDDTNFLSDEEINSASVAKLESLIADKVGMSFSALLPMGFAENTLAREFRTFGLDKIRDIESLITDEFVSDFKDNFDEEENYLGFGRVLMMYSDIKKYFSGFKREWTGLDRPTFDLLCRKYGNEIVQRLLDFHGIDVDNAHFEDEDG